MIYNTVSTQPQRQDISKCHKRNPSSNSWGRNRLVKKIEFSRAYGKMPSVSQYQWVAGGRSHYSSIR